VRRGDGSPGWLIDYTSLSLDHPFLLHPYYGGLAVRRLVPRKSYQSSKTCLLRDNGSNVLYSHQCFGSIYFPPPLELVLQVEVRSTANHLWSLGSWSCLYPNRGHSSILMRFQQSDPIFNMGVHTSIQFLTQIDG
jgi:hypothetical protein